MARQHRQFLAVAFALAAAVMPARAFAQQNGTVTGTVTDQERQAPIPEAQVVVVGTTLGGRTNAQGVYTIAGVPQGSIQLRVLRIGFQSVTRPVTVVAGQSTRVDFTVAPSAVILDQVITTATGEEQRQREKGVTVGRINVDSLPLAPVNNLSDVLSSRTAGVTVQEAGGATGAASRIRIRGSNSISLSNDPILIIDGVRVDNNSQSSRIGVGGQNPSRFNDINPDDIENVEIVKGPAAAALYGTAAANGVIQVTTKRGHAGKTQWNSFAEGGKIYEVTAYPANYEQLGDYGGGDIGPCPLPEQAAGNCTPTGALSVFNPLEDASPFRVGNRQKYGLSAAGGADKATYYVSGDVEREQGVYAPNLLERYNLRANVTGQLRDNLKVTVTSGYLHSLLGRPQNDNNSEGVVSGGLLGTAHDDATHGYYGVLPEDLYKLDTHQNIDRFTNGFNATWQALSWLSANGTAGIDWTHRTDVFNVIPGTFPASFDPDAAVGERQLDPFDIFNYTANGNLTATYLPITDLTTSTSVGVQWNRDYTHGISAFGENITPGIGSLTGANQFFTIDEASATNVTIGGYVSEQLGWRDKVFGTAAVRTDRNSAFGTDFGWVYYPAFSLSWVVGEEGFFPQQPYVSSLRLRAAYGESGQRPTFRQASTYFGAVTASLSGDIPALVLRGTGNSVLKPEKSAEFETGFDATFWRDAARLEFTYYNKNTNDALVARRLAPSLGATNSRYDNIGKVQNSGIEMLLDTKVYKSDPVSFDFTLTGSTNKNKVVSLGRDITPIIFGLGGNTQRHQNGYPLGGYWQQPILSYSDANHDGLLSPDEVQIGDTGVYLGTPFPTREFSVRPRLTLIKNIEISALFDYRGGLKLYNASEDFRCAVFINCRAVNDPSTPLWDQARAVADYAYGTVAGYIENANFTKLREVAVVFRAPNDWANRFGTSGLSLTLAGRNLATWTKYTGLDPEVTYAGASNFNQAEFLSQPAVRYYTARVNVNF
ncbi:MAG: SusC/RagA family TonB-linked outer membrane protein [Gemmatimonadaceae bacterium]